MAAVWRGVKSEFMDSNNRLVQQIQDQAFSREETMDLLNREIESGLEMPKSSTLPLHPNETNHISKEDLQAINFHLLLVFISVISEY